MELYLLCIRWMKRYCKPAALFQEYKFLYDIFGYLWCWHLDIFSYFWRHLNIFGVIWIFVVAFWYFWWHLDICGCGVMREGGEPTAGSANIGVFVRLCLAFVHLQRKLQEHLWNCASGKYSQLWTKWYRKNMLTQLFWSEGLHWETEHLFTTVRRPYAATLLSYNLLMSIYQKCFRLVLILILLWESQSVCHRHCNISNFVIVNLNLGP